MNYLIQIFISVVASVLTVFFVYWLRGRKKSVKKGSIALTNSEKIELLEKRIVELAIRLESIDSLSSQMMVSSTKKEPLTDQHSTVSLQQTKKERKKEKYASKVKTHSNNSNLEVAKPVDVVYTFLRVSEGKLEPTSQFQTSYYRSWQFQGKILYEFYCEPQYMKKVINNHSSIVDPCCMKSHESVSPEEANRIETVEFGVLDSNYSIITRTIIKYV